VESLVNNFIVTITAIISIEEAQYRFIVYVVVRERFSIISFVYTVKLNTVLNLNKIKQARRKYKWDEDGHHLFHKENQKLKKNVAHFQRETENYFVLARKIRQIKTLLIYRKSF